MIDLVQPRAFSARQVLAMVSAGSLHNGAGLTAKILSAEPFGIVKLGEGRAEICAHDCRRKFFTASILQDWLQILQFLVLPIGSNELDSQRQVRGNRHGEMI